MLSSGIAAAFVFHRADHDGVKERAGAYGFLSRGGEVGAAGGLAGVGHKNDYAAAICTAATKSARGEENCVIDGGARAGRHPVYRGLQRRNII